MFKPTALLTALQHVQSLPEAERSTLEQACVCGHSISKVLAVSNNLMTDDEISILIKQKDVIDEHVH